MKIDLKGIVAIVGNYGSGKTETSVNLALLRKNDGLSVKIADLDLVNPYFRMREAREMLTAMGVEIILPDAQYMDADLPILSPQVYGVFQAPSELNILDVGGDDAGSMVLASLNHIVDSISLQVLQVVNPHRPHSGSIEGCSKLRKEIEGASKLKITGIISNANLMDETTLEHVYNGHEFVKNYANESALPLKFITAPERLMSNIDHQRVSCPILPFTRHLAPTWNNRTSMSASLLDNSRQIA